MRENSLRICTGRNYVCALSQNAYFSLGDDQLIRVEKQGTVLWLSDHTVFFMVCLALLVKSGGKMSGWHTLQLGLEL